MCCLFQILCTTEALAVDIFFDAIRVYAFAIFQLDLNLLFAIAHAHTFEWLILIKCISPYNIIYDILFRIMQFYMPMCVCACICIWWLSEGGQLVSHLLLIMIIMYSVILLILEPDHTIRFFFFYFLHRITIFKYKLRATATIYIYIDRLSERQILEKSCYITMIYTLLTFETRDTL